MRLVLLLTALVVLKAQRLDFKRIPRSGDELVRFAGTTIDGGSTASFTPCYGLACSATSRTL